MNRFRLRTQACRIGIQLLAVATLCLLCGACSSERSDSGKTAANAAQAKSASGKQVGQNSPTKDPESNTHEVAPLDAETASKHNKTASTSSPAETNSGVPSGADSASPAGKPAPGPIHHIVLLDDTLSMSDQSGGGESAFRRGSDYVHRVMLNAASSRIPAVVSLKRFSRPAAVDLLREPANEAAVANLKDWLARRKPEDVRVEPREAILGCLSLLAASSGDSSPGAKSGPAKPTRPTPMESRQVVHIVSDFRRADWSDDDSLDAALAKLGNSSALVQLVPCAATPQANLTIAAADFPEPPLASGVPFRLRVRVLNSGSEPATPRWSAFVDDRETESGEMQQLPPGTVGQHDIEIEIADTEPHVIRVQLSDDALAGDNLWQRSIQLPERLRVLLIDDRPRKQGSFFVRMALRPGGIETGFAPLVESPRFLAEQPLERFASICLADVTRLTADETTGLEKYVAAGGGLVAFAGTNPDLDFINGRLYGKGKGLWPLPVTRIASLVGGEPGEADVRPSTDFRILGIPPVLSTLGVEQYLAASSDWEPKDAPEAAALKVLVRLRNGAPLIVSKRYGEGHVLAVLTSAAPEWNNWVRSPFYPAFLPEAFTSVMDSRLQQPPPFIAGELLAVKFDAAGYQPQASISHIDSQTRRASARQTRKATTENDPTGRPKTHKVSFSVRRSGLYQVQLTKTDGERELRKYAANVDPAEGRLEVVDFDELTLRWPNDRVQIVDLPQITP